MRDDPVVIGIAQAGVLRETGHLVSYTLEMCIRDRSLLELEITESAFLQNTEDILKTAGEIKRRGFVLTMDDFGTGYSSLSLLKELPVDIMKLDKTFFHQQMSRREKIVIANVIHLAKELNIQVISEGIETKEHEQFLREIGCELAQGYLYGRPAPFGTYGDAC